MLLTLFWILSIGDNDNLTPADASAGSASNLKLLKSCGLMSVNIYITLVKMQSDLYIYIIYIYIIHINIYLYIYILQYYIYTIYVIVHIIDLLR